MIAIRMCVDRSYFVPALVTLVSLADSHDPGTLRNMSVRLLSPDITAGEASTFQAVARRLGFRSFRYRRVAPSADLVIVNGDYISTATYLRFAFADAFVGEPYLLYLDADVLITGDVTEPFNRLRGDALGAVQDEILQTLNTAPALPGFAARHPEFRDAPYFNAGMFWLAAAGLEAMNRGARRATALGREHIHFNDQDVLNMWLAESGRCVQVPARFNRFELARFFEVGDWMKSLVHGGRDDTGANVLHFIGPDKPWLRRCPGTPGVRLYSCSLRAARAQLSRVRDAAMCLAT